MPLPLAGTRHKSPASSWTWSGVTDLIKFSKVWSQTRGGGGGQRRGGIQADGYCCHCFLLHSDPSLCWLQSPLQSSLLVLDLNDLKLNRLAVDCCISKHTRWHKTSGRHEWAHCLSHLPSPPLTSPPLSSPHLTSPPLSSPPLPSPFLSSPPLPFPLLPSPLLPSPFLSSH